MGAAVADEVGGARRRRGPATVDAGREKELSPPLPVGEGVAVRRSNIEEVAPSVGEGMSAPPVGDGWTPPLVQEGMVPATAAPTRRG